jgi:uncharacterized membrane protein YgcG
MAAPNREHELWSKLLGLPLDRLAEEPAPGFGFLKRLMKSENWDYATAVRVTAEYRRFLLLAYLGPVSPSPMVDAAWHLHLTYTRAYNVGLCERTLGRALDHTPSGGVEETAHYATVYADTRERYSEVFGEEPPADIWPGPDLPIDAAASGRAAGGARFAGGVVALLLAGGAFLALLGKSFVMFAFLLFGTFIIIAAISNKKRGDGSCGSGGGCGGDGGGDGGGGCGGGGCGGGCG